MSCCNPVYGPGTPTLPPAQANLPFYVNLNTNYLYYWTGTSWVQINTPLQAGFADSPIIGNGTEGNHYRIDWAQLIPYVFNNVPCELLNAAINRCAAPPAVTYFTPSGAQGSGCSCAQNYGPSVPVGSFTTLASCQQFCAAAPPPPVVTYFTPTGASGSGCNCTQNQGASIPAGSFADLASCQQFCAAAPPPTVTYFTPTGAGGSGCSCIQGSGASIPAGSFGDLASCQQFCSSPPPVINFFTPTGTQGSGCSCTQESGPAIPSGSFADLASCQQFCASPAPVVNYWTPTGPAQSSCSCVQGSGPSVPNGSFATLGECVGFCQPPAQVTYWVNTAGSSGCNCMAQTGTSAPAGSYADQASCQAACPPAPWWNCATPQYSNGTEGEQALTGYQCNQFQSYTQPDPCPGVGATLTGPYATQADAIASCPGQPVGGVGGIGAAIGTGG